MVSRLEGLFENLEDLDLQITKAVASDLEDLQSDLSSLEGDATLNKDQVIELTKAIKKMDATLDAELALRHAYIITPKRYDVVKLMDRPGEILGKGVFLRLSPNATRDFTLGCKCIAFAQPTAAAFHFLRATEEMLRQLYMNRVLKKNRPQVLLWAHMVDTLRTLKKGKPKIALLDHLDMVRRNYRNPTQHPELFYDNDASQDLLSNCASALNLICAELPRKNEDDLPF